MSEPDPKDDGPAPGPGRLPRWWLRAAGIGLVAVAVLARLATTNPSFGLVAWGAGLIGFALAAFGGLAPEPILGELEPPAAPEPPPVASPARTARIGLAALGGIAVAYGLLRVTIVAWQEQRATVAWWPVVIGATALLGAAIWGAVARAEPSPVRVDVPKGTAHRALITLGVAAALVIQIAVPMTYYQGEDRFDERFAWRMFSAVRVYRCDLGAFDLNDTRVTPVDLAHTIHVAWVNTMQRGREGVIQRYLTWRCETAEIDGARVTNRCVTPEGQRVPDLIREIDCSNGELRAVEVQ